MSHTASSSPEREIAELEERRYDAVVRADYEAFASLCHEELVYTHSNGERDTLASYLEKCQAGFYVYHSIDHPVDQIKVIGDVALVLGAMKADLTVSGKRKQLDNSSLAVWFRDAAGWRLLAYQPTPYPSTGAEGERDDDPALGAHS